MGIINFLLILLCFINCGFAFDCQKLIFKVKSASDFVLGVNYPWWYNVGQIEVESNCLWRTSLDGWGSIGYAQITPKFWDETLKNIFPNWQVKDSTDYFLAHAYVIKDCLNKAYCKYNLWNAYQCYNRNCSKVNREAKNGLCNWAKAKEICEINFVENICVWKKDNVCKQWKTNCEINYNYGFKVWKKGLKYRNGIIEKTWSYW